MATTEMNCLASGGGNVKSGDIPDTTSSSQLVEIETGLATVERFILSAYMTSNETSFQSEVVYDASVSTTTYNSVAPYSGGTYGGITSIGSAPTEHCWKLDSVVGGKVTLHTASRSGWGNNSKIKWYAE